MKKLFVILLAAFGALAGTAAAQDTNNLKTSLGVFEAQTGVILVKSYAVVGSVAAGSSEISVRYKETTDAGSGQKCYGLAIEIEGGPFPHTRILVDDDEIDPLLNAINYLIKINFDVTTLPGFEASFTTKAGLRVIATGVRRNGGVLNWLQYDDTPRISLTSMQLSQLYDLIAQARKNLAVLKAAK
jgi:hypothetical protein